MLLFSQKAGTNHTHLRGLIHGGVKLEYSTKIKYLGLTLDQKLTFKSHIEEKCLKAKRLLNLTKQVVGREWGLSPQKVMWVYNSIVKPQITYGALVWANKINKTLRKKLDSVQRLALLGCTHAMRSTPTAGMEAILGIPPLSLYCREVSLKAAYRVLPQQNWQNRGDSSSHRDVHLSALSRLLPSDHVPFQKVFGVNHLPPPVQISDPKFNVYTDGSKSGKSTGYGYGITQGDYILEERSVNLGKDSTVFMAEMLAITNSLQVLGAYLNSGESATIWTDSRSSIDAIYSPVITQPLALETHNALCKILSTNPINIEWVRGHNDNTGNEMADFLAKKGRDSASRGEDTSNAHGGPALPPYTPPSHVKNLIKDYIWEIWKEEWTESNLHKFKHSRQMLKVPNKVPLIQPGRSPLGWGRDDLKIMVEVITGHCLLNKHLSHWKDLPSVKCRLCDEEDETYHHLVTECPATELDRRQILRGHYESPIDYFKDLNRFVNTKRVHALRRADLS